MTASAAKKFTWLFGTFFLILLLRGDGYFPFPATVPPVLFRSIVLVQTAALAWIAVYFLYALNKTQTFEPIAVSSSRYFIFIALCAAAVAALHVLQAARFAPLGYHPRWQIFAAVLASSALALALLWNVNRFAAVLSSGMILKIYPLLAFPIVSGRSDMLPIITEAIKQFMQGENIYRYYLLDNGVMTQIVRFPGIIASYIPIHWLHGDPRLTLILSESLFFILAWKKWGQSSYFLPAACLLIFFPYWHYRHELYEMPFWFLHLAASLSLNKKNAALHLILFSALLSFHQWGILFAPFLFVYAARRHSFYYAAVIFLFSAAGAFFIVNLFSRGDLRSFLAQTFLYYHQALAVMIAEKKFHPFSLYFTPEIIRAFGAPGLKIINGGTQIVLIAAACFKLKDLSSLFGMMALSLLFMLMTNAVCWTYQYIPVGILLWLSFLEKESF